MTLNERCAKCLGWEVVEHNMGHNKDYFDKYGTPVMPVESFHPDTDRDHSQLMVEAVTGGPRPLTKGDAKKLNQVSRQILRVMKIEDEEKYLYESYDEAIIMLATPAQISEAACEVLEQ